MVTDAKLPDAKEDSRLVNASKKGDSSAFEQLVTKYQKRMLNIAFRVTGNYDDACDITQDSFIAAWRKISDFRGDAKFSTWLTAIVINQSRNRLDQIRTSLSRQAYSLDSSESGIDCKMSKDTPCKAPNALEKLEESELRRFIEGCIQKLPAEFREVLVLRDIQDLSYDEVKSALGLKDGTVRSRLFRARESVRDCLKGALGVS